MSVAEAAPLRASGSLDWAEAPADPVLVARLRDGDERAFESIFRRYHPTLLAFCRHMLGGRDDAEDALQQAFIRAHRALLSGSPPRELRPWLYAIARNCCLSAIAARRPGAGLDIHDPSFDGLCQEVHEREDLRELVADLQGLPEDQRSALLLAELEDLPHREIAAVLGCPVNKVKALVHQARVTLIAQRDARAAPCQEIRVQLSVGRGGELRRRALRRHLGVCAGCREYAGAVRSQRLSLAIVLPVLPSAGLAARVLGHTALHGGGLYSAGSLAAAGGGHGAAAALAAGGGSSCAAVPAAVGAGAAGASASAGAGALAGGGLAAKLAIGSAVAVIASAGAVTALPHRRAHAAAARRAPRAHGAGNASEAPAGSRLAAAGAASIATVARNALLHPSFGSSAGAGARAHAAHQVRRRPDGPQTAGARSTPAGSGVRREASHPVAKRRRAHAQLQGRGPRRRAQPSPASVPPGGQRTASPPAPPRRARRPGPGGPRQPGSRGPRRGTAPPAGRGSLANGQTPRGLARGPGAGQPRITAGGRSPRQPVASGRAGGSPPHMVGRRAARSGASSTGKR